MSEKVLRFIEAEIKDCVRKNKDSFENREIMTIIKNDELNFFDVRNFKKMIQ